MFALLRDCVVDVKNLHVGEVYRPFPRGAFSRAEFLARSAVGWLETVWDVENVLETSGIYTGPLGGTAGVLKHDHQPHLACAVQVWHERFSPCTCPAPVLRNLVSSSHVTRFTMAVAPPR